jgi:mercuric ion transport protein
MDTTQPVRSAQPPVPVPLVPRTHLATGLGAITAASLASLCCIGPVLFVTLGVGAGLASRFEPLRPLFTVLTLALLGLGFYTVYGRRPAAAPACSDAETCAAPRNRTRDKILLWTAAIVAVIVLTFPQWSLLFV